MAKITQGEERGEWVLEHYDGQWCVARCSCGARQKLKRKGWIGIPRAGCRDCRKRYRQMFGRPLDERDMEQLGAISRVRGGMSLEEIAEIYGVSRERVRQIQERALRKYRKGMQRLKLQREGRLLDRDDARPERRGYRGGWNTEVA